jgi:16S rRNA (uracil1498-N3)-methyltransferase
MDLHTFLAATTGERLRLLLAPDATQELKALTPAAAVTLLVGPEGGLSLDERRSAEGSGFIRVRFGPRVLRTETASLAAIAAMQALWGDC